MVNRTIRPEVEVDRIHKGQLFCHWNETADWVEFPDHSCGTKRSTLAVKVRRAGPCLFNTSRVTKYRCTTTPLIIALLS